MKKFISIVMSFVLVFSFTFPVFAESQYKRVDDCSPVILVRGMDFNGVMLDIGTENERAVNDFNTFGLIGDVASICFSWLITSDKQAAVGKVIDTAYNMLRYNAMGEDGNPVYNTGVAEYKLSVNNYPELFELRGNEPGMVQSFADEFGGENVYYFTYDWRLDPYVIADKINDTVELAKRISGKDKVNIVCSSMGGIMTVAYLTKYGYESVDRCIFMSSTFCGSQVVSDALQGKIKVTSDGLYNYLLSFTTGNFATRMMVKFLNLFGVFGWLTRITDYMLENNKDDIYNDVLKPIFVYSPCI